MQTANYMLNQWAPALLVCFTMVTGLIYQNSRITDLRESMNKRIDDLKTSIDRRLDQEFKHVDQEFKHINERIDRLESPIVRK